MIGYSMFRPIEELNGNIYVSVDELYKRDDELRKRETEIINLSRDLRNEKEAYIRMYHDYLELQDRTNAALKYIGSKEQYDDDFDTECIKLKMMLKGE